MCTYTYWFVFKMYASLDESKAGMRDWIYVYLIIMSIYWFAAKTV